MKYYEIEFTLSPCSQDTRDVLCAMAGIAGCESFEETADGLKAYIQQSMFAEQAIRELIDNFPFTDCHIIYKVREAEDRDWNEQWEQEGFEPIVLSNLVIHDGRHLPDIGPDTIAIEIDAHLAFGTGTHETTRMMCSRLLELPLSGKRVLDCGCGTGILGICALKLGAAACVGYDIDEWSADNTRHNAVINRVDDRLQALCGDASLLEDGVVSADFDVVMANINRNILLADMPRFVGVMAPGALLLLSGFYQNDCALLESKAQKLGLSHRQTLTDGDWACMVFQYRSE